MASIAETQRKSEFDVATEELKTRLDRLEKEMQTLKLDLERLRLSRIKPNLTGELKLK